MLRGSCVIGVGIVVPLPSWLLELSGAGGFRWASSASERGFHLGVREGSVNICWLYWSPDSFLEQCFALPVWGDIEFFYS